MVVRQLNSGNQAKTYIVKKVDELTNNQYFLKVYNRSGREFFETERKILTKVTNNKWPGFPRLHTTKSNN